ncbi:MAG: DUF885 domain-containing protein [Acidobacteriota bacterium]
MTKSDANTQLVTEFYAKYIPELFGALGLEEFDEDILQISTAIDAQAKREQKTLVIELNRRLEAEEDVAVRQDLEILIDVLELDLRETELEESLMLPYFNLAETIFRGIRSLLDEQVPEERRAAALVRLRRYAGLEEGYTPLTEQAEVYIRERLEQPELLGPFREEIDNDLARAPRLVAGLGKLFESYDMNGWEEPYAALEAQLAAYQAFVEEEVLPRARDDFRLPPELYAVTLEDLGVDMPVAELTSRAKVTFKEIQNEMQTLAGLIAEDEGLEDDDYRAVLRHLKTRQLTEDRILDFYSERIEDVEAIIARENVTSLPTRELQLRLATEAEEAMIQAATIRWPQLLGEAAEYGEIILPVRRAATGDRAGDTDSDATADSAGDEQIDDFTYEAAAWSLIVHEGRPGHELQLASIMERGVSKARAFYAINSTNVEGWALYAESEMKPYLPLDAQLVSLQHRLMRAARAFLDPGLQLGEITPDQAMRVLMEDVVVSKPLAEQEVERYTSDSPGQATAYFCGYSRLLELRTEVELLLADAFDRRAFNDFVLDQGLVPPALLRQAVMEEFVGGS